MRFKLIMGILLVLGILMVGCAKQAQKIEFNYNDVELSNFKWESCFNPGEYECNDMPISYNINGALVGAGNLMVYSSKERAYARVYVNRELGSSTKDYAFPLVSGDNRIHLWDISLDSLYGDVTFKVCFSGNREVTQESPGVICKEKSFSKPTISVSVSPDPLTFNINKNDVEFPRKKVTVTNIGNIPIHITVLLPSYAVKSLNYPTSSPQYGTFGFVDYPDHPRNPPKGGEGMIESVDLLPGESAQYDATVSIGNFGVYNTPIGTYTSEGYALAVYPTMGMPGYINSFDQAKFKKTFSITTEVK